MWFFLNADYIMRNGLLIGCHQGLNIKHIKYIHLMITSYLKNENICVKNIFKIFINEKNFTYSWWWWFFWKIYFGFYVKKKE